MPLKRYGTFYDEMIRKGKVQELLEGLDGLESPFITADDLDDKTMEELMENGFESATPEKIQTLSALQSAGYKVDMKALFKAGGKDA